MHANQSSVALAIDISIYQSTWNFCGLLEVIHKQLSTMMTLATKILIVLSNWLLSSPIYMCGQIFALGTNKKWRIFYMTPTNMIILVIVASQTNPAKHSWSGKWSTCSLISWIWWSIIHVCVTCCHGDITLAIRNYLMGHLNLPKAGEIAL